jgi:4'-phosphopantetheinyl transferase
LTTPVVDVWRLSLTASPAIREPLWGLLCERERQRAGRFAFERDRDRFVVAHGAVRSILSLYTRVSGRELEFVAGSAGKPALPAGAPRFNLSHSGDQALLAVSWECEVGVDLEAVRALEDIDGLAATCFSATERRVLAQLPEALRLEAFYDGWTRKEAFLKLLGDGLSRPLDSFDVTLTPGEPARLLRVAGERAGRWVLQSLEVGGGHRGALASEAPAPVVRLKTWEIDGLRTRREGSSFRKQRAAGVEP